jgi:hypothetical protein
VVSYSRLMGDEEDLLVALNDSGSRFQASAGPTGQQPTLPRRDPRR